MEFSMRDSIFFVALGVALAAGTSMAQAQEVETIETVRTVTTTEPRRVRRRVVHARPVARVTTTTRTVIVRQGVATAAPAYDELRRGPRLYDVVTSGRWSRLHWRHSRSLPPRARLRRRLRCRPIATSTSPIASWWLTPTPTLPCRRSRAEAAANPLTITRRRLG